MNDLQELTLSQRLQQPMPPQEAFRYTVSLAESLRQLHDENCVFGTMDPSKVILTETGVKLVHGNGAAGVSPYMAPEQLAGKSADARTDIYGFGALVYEMLSGRTPFEGQTQEELKAAILERDPGPLTAVQPALAQVVAKCLEKQPANRWQRMQKVLLELKLITMQSRDAEATRHRIETVLRAQIRDLEGRLAVRVVSNEGAIAELRRGLTEQADRLHLAERTGTDVSAELASVQQQLQLQAHAVQSVQNALAQTDDLLERVVDALGALQRSVADQFEPERMGQ